MNEDEKWMVEIHVFGPNWEAYKYHTYFKSIKQFRKINQEHDKWNLEV